MTGKNISHYKILEELGRGGMGVVYKAEDTKLKRLVAIKFLPSQLAVHGEERERFTLEAQAASALNHPNVATIYEIDEAQGETFIVMEYVEGQTLREKLHVGPTSDSALSVKQVVDIGVQIAEGLAAAHEKGIVHRDVKAENIMLKKDGRVQVMDFGLAKLRGVSKLTKMGSTIGTIAYMSPEQVQGIETDQRTDIFSLGVVLYELLTGQLPFKGGHEAAVMYEIVNVQPSHPSQSRPEIEPELDRIIQKCLEKDREERYQSVKEVAVDLKHFRRDSEGRRMERKTPVPGTVSRSSAQGPEPLPAPSDKRRLLLIIMSIALLGLAGFVVWKFSKPSAQISQNMIFKPLQLPYTTVWYPGLSADGNWIAFPATDAENVTEIYYMHASGGEPKKLTNDSLWKFVADISPDGSQIAYAEGSSRQPLSFPLTIRTVSTLGGPSKLIAYGANGPRYSPDGASIAYIARGSALWTMNTDGSNKKMVLKDSVNGGRVSLAWSPDGKSLAWLRGSIGESGLYEEIILVEVETQKERQLTNDKKNIDELYWMPQGEILYSSNREGASNLWAIPSDGGSPMQITRGPGPDLGIKASKDGKRVLYMQASAFGAVMLGGPDGSNPRQITPDDMTVVSPTFSPDGKQIAFVVKDPDPIKSQAFLYLVDRDGHNRRRLTTTPENIENFVWSPDGRRIAYAVHVNIETDSAHKIAIVDVTDPTQKLIAGNGRVMQWSGDGNTLNVLSNATTWRVTLSDGKKVLLYEDSTFAVQSPDGQKLLIYDNHKGRMGLSVKIGESPLKRLLDGPVDGAAGSIRWLPDSKRFVYSKGGSMWIVSIDTGEQIPYPWKRSDAVAFTDISPDGNETLFVRERLNGKLILIDNFH